MTKNKHLASLGGESHINSAGDKNFVHGKLESAKGPSVTRQMPTIDPKDLVGSNFLKDTEKNGYHFRAKIVCAIRDKEA